MNAQLKPNNIENRKQLSKPGIFSYIQQYKTQGPSLVNKTIDLFHQLGTVLNEHDNNTNNPDIMRKLVHQVKIAPPQEERSVGLSFIKETELDVWDQDGDFLYTWAAESQSVFNIYVSYMLKSRNRIYIKTNEGTSFIVETDAIQLEYELNLMNKLRLY